MTVGEFRHFMASLSSGRESVTTPTNIFTNQIMIAIMEVATDTVPRKLVVTHKGMSKMFRKLGDNFYLRMPKKVMDENSQIDLDEELLPALGYRILITSEPQRGNYYYKMYREQIENYSYRMLEDGLDEVTTDEERRRLNAFP